MSRTEQTDPGADGGSFVCGLFPPQPAPAVASNDGSRRLLDERKPHARWTDEELAEVAALANKIGVGHAAARIGYHEHSLRMTFTRHGYRRQWVKVER